MTLTHQTNGYHITYKIIYGKSADVNIENVKTWKEKLLVKLKYYMPNNIFNTDETGLYFHTMQTKTHALQNDKCSGRKTAKPRIRILLCVNIEGEKEEPFIVN